MRMRLFTVVGALAASALAAGAVPALSADRGTIAISITAQAPPAPCLTVTPGSVDFGTLPFSTIALDSFGRTNITVDNCGSAGQNLLAATTDATGPSGSWTPIAFSGAPDPCQTLNRNGFYLELFTPDPFRSLFMTGTPAPVRQATSGTPEVFPAGEQVFHLSILMPCVGSNGAGETKTLTATFTAVVP